MPGSFSPDPISLAVNASLSGIQAGVGLINAGKAKKEADLLKRTRPVRTTSKQAVDQLALSESELANGMSSEAEAAYENGIDRDLSTSIDAILKGGGSVNNIGDLFGSSNEARQRLAMTKDNLRLNQINNLVRAQSNMQNEEEMNFSYNKVQPWADAAAANAKAREAANSQIWNAVNTAGSAAMNYSSEVNDANKLNAYFNVPQTRTTPQVPTTPILQPLPNYLDQTVNSSMNRLPSLMLDVPSSTNRNFIGPMLPK